MSRQKITKKRIPVMLSEFFRVRTPAARKACVVFSLATLVNGQGMFERFVVIAGYIWERAFSEIGGSGDEIGSWSVSRQFLYRYNIDRQVVVVVVDSRD